MSTSVYHFEAFSSRPGQGNPAGVVLDAQHLSDDAMQVIARRVGFNETAFVLPSSVADLRLRYFTPGHEIDLCGHATIASLFALHERGRRGPGELAIETRAGVLPMAIRNVDDQIVIEMSQAAAQLVPFTEDRAALADVLGIEEGELHAELPIMFGSTGTWTLLVPVTSLQAIRAMRPENARFPNVLGTMPRASIHPFCLETIDPTADLHSRHFSSPYSGTVEDPVTGTASGVMAAYMATHAAAWMADHDYSTVVEQGQEVGRDGRVHVRVTNREPPFRVNVSGTAVYIRDISGSLSDDRIA